MNSLVGILTIGSTGVAILLLAVLLYRRDSLSRKLSRKFRMLSARVDEYNQRVRVVETHAADYMNSLGPDGSRLLAEIRTTVDSINYLLSDVGGLLATRDLGALQEAQELLSGQHPEQLQETKNYDGTVSRRFTLPEDWESRLEAMIQRAGQEVSSASMQASESGIPKRKKPQPTIFSLFKAGIRTKNGPYGW